MPLEQPRTGYESTDAGMKQQNLFMIAEAFWYFEQRKTVGKSIAAYAEQFGNMRKNFGIYFGNF